MSELVAQSLAFGNFAEEPVAIGEDLRQELPEPRSGVTPVEMRNLL